MDLVGGDGCGQLNLGGCLSYPYPDETTVIGDSTRAAREKVSELAENGARVVPYLRSLKGNESSRVLLKHAYNTFFAIGMQLLADQQADALVSSADTKEIMMLGRSVLGTLQGPNRPARPRDLSGPRGQFYMLELGASINCLARFITTVWPLGQWVTGGLSTIGYNCKRCECGSARCQAPRRFAQHWHRAWQR